jgi:hypothetical protein
MPRKQPPKPESRQPVRHSPELAAAICLQLADGKSLRAICGADGMPTEAAVRSWALDDVGGFAAHYARARELGYERLGEELLAIADTPCVGVKKKLDEKGNVVETTEGDMIEHRRLQIDARKWMLAKMLPKRYGDRITQEVTGDLGVAVTATVSVTPRPQLSREEWLKLHGVAPLTLENV